MRIAARILQACLPVGWLVGCGDATPAAIPPALQDGGTEPQEEVCNFVDDNGDGHVDEGFGWEPAPWVPVLITEKFASASLPIPLPDGSIVIPVFDHLSATGDLAVVVRVDREGQVLAGPTRVPIPYCGNGVVAARWGDAQILLVHSSRTWEGREPCLPIGCPWSAVLLDATTLEVQAKKSVRGLNLAGAYPYELVCGDSLCTISLRDSSAEMPWIVAQFDPIAAEVVSHVTFLGSDWLAFAGQEPIDVWRTRPLDDSLCDAAECSGIVHTRVQGGVPGVESAPVTVGPKLALDYRSAPRLVEDHWELGVTSGEKRDTRFSILSLGIDGYSEPTTLWESSELLVANPVPIREARLVFAQNPQKDAFALMLYRLSSRSDLTPAPRNPVQVGDYANIAHVLSTQAGPVLVRSTYDGQSVEVAPMRCVESLR